MTKKRLTLALIIVAIVLLLLSGVLYYLAPSTNTNNVVYGTKDGCEQATGKRCVFDLCQVEQGSTLDSYDCVSGWKPEY